MTAPRRVLELGADHQEYGSYSFGSLSEQTVWAISVGADHDSPSLQYKGDLDYRNEDGLLAIEDGDRVLLAVADGHFGREASHDLLSGVDAAAVRVPRDPCELAAIVIDLAAKEPVEGLQAATSLLVAVCDRADRSGFGLSYGDSTFAVVGSAGHRRHGEPTMATFVSPAFPKSLDPANASSFAFTAEPDDVLLAYTDGIDECHYQHPETSITTAMMADMAREAEGILNYTRQLVELALAGVDGNPGGQDNIAIVAAAV